MTHRAYKLGDETVLLATTRKGRCVAIWTSHGIIVQSEYQPSAKRALYSLSSVIMGQAISRADGIRLLADAEEEP